MASQRRGDWCVESRARERPLVAQQTRAVTDSDEVALGAALAAQLSVDRGLVASLESDAIEAYLQSIADSLGRHARRHFRWKVHYDPHPGLKSGFALPGGHIVIWGGILAYMSTDDEVAAIIAHEIEHIDDGQVSRRIDSLIASKRRDVHAPAVLPAKAIVDRINQIEKEIADERWEALTKTHRIRLPGSSG